MSKNVLALAVAIVLTIWTISVSATSGTPARGYQDMPTTGPNGGSKDAERDKLQTGSPDTANDDGSYEDWREKYPYATTKQKGDTASVLA